MELRDAISNLHYNYKKYGVSRSFISDMLKNGINEYGLDVETAYNGLRMLLGEKCGTTELFSVDEIQKMLGLSREETLRKIEKMRMELSQNGEKPDNYFRPVYPKSTLYFPSGLTS